MLHVIITPTSFFFIQKTLIHSNTRTFWAKLICKWNVWNKGHNSVRDKHLKCDVCIPKSCNLCHFIRLLFVASHSLRHTEHFHTFISFGSKFVDFAVFFSLSFFFCEWQREWQIVIVINYKMFASLFCFCDACKGAEQRREWGRKTGILFNETVWKSTESNCNNTHIYTRWK